MKHPFVAVVSFYALGLLFAEIFQPPLPLLFAASFFILILALAFKKFRPLLICLLLAFAAWTNLIFHTSIIAPDDLRKVIGDKTEIVALRGSLTQSPQIKITERDGEQMEHSLTQIK